MAFRRLTFFHMYERDEENPADQVKGMKATEHIEILCLPIRHVDPHVVFGKFPVGKSLPYQKAGPEEDRQIHELFPTRGRSFHPSYLQKGRAYNQQDGIHIKQRRNIQSAGFGAEKECQAQGSKQNGHGKHQQEDAELTGKSTDQFSVFRHIL